MTRWSAASLCIACAFQAFACSPDDGEEAHAQGDAAVMSMGSALDSGVAAPGAIPLDASALDAAEAGGSLKAEAGAMDATSAHDTSASDAGSLVVDASQSDASRALDAGAESSVSSSADPSAGCGKSGRPSGGRISVQGDHNYTFPVAYDGKQPLPLLIGFHAASNPIDQIEKLTQGSDFENKYVRAFPKSKGSAWDYAADIGKVLAMYDDLVANHCVDQNRVFATGHSSGAQLIVQILTPAHKADADHLRFRAVAPVAASRYGGVSRAIPTLYIQGQHDNVRNSDGSDVVKEFTTANGCMAASKPYTGIMACSSAGKSVKDGCIQYEGCKAPTVWCSHDDPQYSDTNHGWPCFATKAMYKFFEELP